MLAWDAEMLARLTRAGFARADERRLLRRRVRAAQLGGEPGGRCDPEVAFTAIYSQRDGIVDWRACLDPAATQVEVRTSHCGMAVDPVVMDHVLAALREQQVRRASRQAGPDAAAGSLHVARR